MLQFINGNRYLQRQTYFGCEKFKSGYILAAYDKKSVLPRFGGGLELRKYFDESELVSLFLSGEPFDDLLIT